MKRIAFIDHDIDNFHANTFSRLLMENDLGFRLTSVWANRRNNLAHWAAERNVVVAETVADLAPLADYVMVLAPSNPETHLDLCNAAFTLGKPTYVDKTFAPNLAQAEAIFAAADAAGVAVQTSSVLRYTELQTHCQSRPEHPPTLLSAWASGGNFNEYLVHPLEAVVSVMGPEVESITTESIVGAERITLRFSGNRMALIQIHINHRTPFFYMVSDREKTTPVSIDSGSLFRNGLHGILEFFKAGKALIPRGETLAIMQALDVLTKQR